MVWLLGGHCPWRGQVPATCCCPLAKRHFHAVPVPLARAAPSPGSSQPLADDVLVGVRGRGRCLRGSLEGVWYLSPLRLAALLPGRAGGVRPEAALARERRNGRRRLQGYVGLGEGRSRRPWFLGWKGA